VTISYGALAHPFVALAVAAMLLVVILASATYLIRALRRQFTRRRSGAP
jgi:hypothetical protein